MSLAINEHQLVMTAVQGGVSPANQWAPFEVGSQGELFAWPSTGGITYNVKIGDSVFGWMGEHLEPGVSATLNHKSSKAASGFQFLSCCGNGVRVISGDAKGATGTVLGHHGGVDHLMLDFPDHVLDQLTCDDKFLVRGYGQGLRFIDHPEIHCYNFDPCLLQYWGIRELDAQHIEVPVTAIVPSFAMGSGIGALSVTTGDYDILCHDKDMVREHGLDCLRLGDFVAVQDHDNIYGRSYRKGAMSIGVIIHSDSPLGGHGPGMMTLMSACDQRIVPVLDPHANLGELLSIGRFASS